MSRKEDVLTGINALHDHFDQKRFDYKQDGSDEKVAATKTVLDRLNEAEEEVNNKNYSDALSSINSLRHVSKSIERVDPNFDWDTDPVVNEWVTDIKTNLSILNAHN